MSFLFKNYSLVKVIHLLIKCCKTSFFLWKTNNADRNGVNKQSTHTHTHQTPNTQRKTTLERVSMKKLIALFKETSEPTTCTFFQKFWKRNKEGGGSKHALAFSSVYLWTRWLWVQVQLQSFKLKILCLLQARSSLIFRQL